MCTSSHNLREERFQLTSDPTFFHLAETHAAALATLVEAVTHRRGLVVMSGPIGTGKTTVLRTALQILTERATVSNPIASAFVLNPTVTRDEFLELVIMEFEIPCVSPSKPARLAALQRMLLDMQRKGGTAILLIDEAHLLSPDLLGEIHLLGNTDTHQEKLLQIVLCGQPEMLTLLQRPEWRALQQRIAASCALRPLNFAEIRAYIEERLYAAGLRGAAYPFSTQALESISCHSQGVPRLINRLCDACLAIRFKTQRSLVQMDIVEEAANELGMIEAPPMPAIEERTASLAPVNGTSPKATATDAGTKSTFDVLIQAMKQRRGSASE